MEMVSQYHHMKQISFFFQQRHEYLTFRVTNVCLHIINNMTPSKLMMRHIRVINYIQQKTCLIMLKKCGVTHSSEDIKKNTFH